jgi:hypothetical protein
MDAETYPSSRLVLLAQLPREGVIRRGGPGLKKPARRLAKIQTRGSFP